MTAMKFLCLCYYNAAEFAALGAEDFKKMQEICEPQDKALRDSGHLRFVGSLGMPDQTRTLRVNGASVQEESGPYENSPNPLGAFFMIEAANIDEAVKI